MRELGAGWDVEGKASEVASLWLLSLSCWLCHSWRERNGEKCSVVVHVESEEPVWHSSGELRAVAVSLGQVQTQGRESMACTLNLGVPGVV